MDKLRLASPEEVDALQLGSDITPATTVMAFENAQTGQPDFAVMRMVFEIDPVHYAPETTDRRKAIFAWGLENGLRMQGTIPAYYFNVSAEAEAAEWRKVVENFGAEKISKTPEYRYKKLL